MALHSHSCMKNSQDLVWRRLRLVYLLAPQFDLILSDDEKAAWNAFWPDVTGFLGNVNAVNCSTLWRILQLLTRSLVATCHSRCVSSIRFWIPFKLTVVP